MRVTALLLACLLPAAAAASIQSDGDDTPTAETPTVAEALAGLADGDDDDGDDGNDGSSRLKAINLDSYRRRAADDDRDDAEDAAAPAAPRVANDGRRDLVADLEEAARLYRAEDFDGAARLLGQVIDDPGFDALPDDARLFALSNAGWLAGADGDNARAFALYRRASETPGAEAGIWEMRALNAYFAGDLKDAAKSLHTLATRWPELLPDVDPPVVLQVVSDSERGSAERIALLQALADAGYAPRRGDDASLVGYELALERLAAGDTAAAKTALATITGADTLVMVRADRRFDALIDRAAPQFDVVRAAQRRVNDLRARAYLDENILGLQTWLVQAMMTVGEAENALALADEVEAMFARSPDPGYVDPEQRRWMRLFRAQAMLYLGRDADSEAALVAAAAPDAQGRREETAIVLLGAVQCSRGRGADGLATVGDGGAYEDFTRLLAELVRVCAANQTGDAATVNEALAWLRENRAIERSLYTEGLLWAGKVDEAAADMVARLRDPALRGEALLDLQEFEEMPELPAEAKLSAAWDALRAHPDVKAAVAEFGRVETYPIFKP